MRIDEWPDNTRQIDTFSDRETFALGRIFGEKAVPGQVFALNGDLGTGKTVFAQGFASGLGVSDYVSSPTFTILQVYEEGRLPLYHFDVYRIADPEEMEEIGFEEYLYSEGVCLIEWAELIPELLPEERTQITIEKLPGEADEHRRITVREFIQGEKR